MERMMVTEALQIIVLLLSGLGLTGVTGAYFEQLILRRTNTIKRQMLMLEVCEKAVAINETLREAGTAGADLKNMTHVLEEFDNFLGVQRNGTNALSGDYEKIFLNEFDKQKSIGSDVNTNLAKKFVEYSQKNVFFRYFTAPGFSNFPSFVYFSIFVLLTLIIIWFSIVGVTYPFMEREQSEDLATFWLGLTMMMLVVFGLMQVFRQLNRRAFMRDIKEKIIDAQK